MPACPFCGAAALELVWSDELAVAFRDRYPVSEGHTLVIPRRHVATYFEATAAERQALWAGVEQVKRQLDASLSPDGYNVGFNAGVAAGQTVMHLHLHVIPRYHGDMDDPRGGIRGVIPERRIYEGAPQPAVVEEPFAELASFVPGEEIHLVDSLRAALREADQIDIVAAFVRLSGLRKLGVDIVDALKQGKSVRILTGDYFGLTQATALQRLLTWTTWYDNLQARLYHTGGTRAFHPKAYIFVQGRAGVAFVGSSNLSDSALTGGIEWNVKSTSRDAATFAAIRARFDQLFEAQQSKPLTRAMVEDYQARAPTTPLQVPAEVVLDPDEVVPEPHGIQVEVLEQLTRTREAGQRKGLVVMATGLGKTYLSAFDFMQLGGRRALFVAHREEILEQASDTWSRLMPDRTVGLLVGSRKEPDADLLFASVQTLSRVRHLRQFGADHFDYVVIDEFHHAAAYSYRKLLDYFEPRFLLGLTATPDRTDGARLLELCDDNEVARVGLVEGITRGFLVPFRYFGVKDEVDFAPIPWRSGRFDAEALSSAVSTNARAAQALREYRRHAPPERRCTLVFCCSRAHADFMADYLSRHRVPAASVHSGPTSASRGASLEKLRSGELEAICAVDVFNEGLDVPDINTILMLRPTESPVVFLQQLGRGLRKSRSLPKDALVVIDFIGNHRAFTTKPVALVSMVGRQESAGVALRLLRAGLTLPSGCGIEIETEAIDMLEQVARLSKADHFRYVYASFIERYGRRPSAIEVFSKGVHFKPIKSRYGSYFDFVEEQGDLRDEEVRVLAAHRQWFGDLQRTSMTKSYKMINLEAQGMLDVLHSRVSTEVLAARCFERLSQDPVLRADLETLEASKDAVEFERSWRKAPLRVFHDAKDLSRRWFELDGSSFVSRLDVAVEDREVFDAMTAELVELRLAEYRAKIRPHESTGENGPFELDISHSSGKPILRIKGNRSLLPAGDVPVLVGEERFIFKFVKVAINVARREPGGPNVMAEVLRGLFGESVGQPGTRYKAELERSANGSWVLRPRRDLVAEAKVIPLRRRLPYFEDLRVACGYAESQYEGHDQRSEIEVASTRDVDPRRHFVVRASGSSMDGGPQPIRDGDLVLIERATVTDPREVEGQPVLLTGGRAEEALAYLKIPVRVEGRWVLRSSNPSMDDLPLEPDVELRVVGRVLEVVKEPAGH